MSKNKLLSTISSTIDNVSRGQMTRSSLQLPQNHNEYGQLRHTQSQNYDKRKKLKPVNKQVPVIPEDEQFDEVDLQQVVVETVNDTARASFIKRNDVKRGSKVSQISKKSSDSRRNSINSSRKESGYDNAAFDGDSSFRSENPVRKATTITNSRTSVRDPSVQSLTVIREQYCCCSKWSRCERLLMTAVAILALIIVTLVILVVWLAQNSKGVDEEFRWSF